MNALRRGLRWPGTTGRVPRTARHRGAGRPPDGGPIPQKPGTSNGRCAADGAMGHGEPLQDDRRPQREPGAAAGAPPSGQRRSHCLSARGTCATRPSSNPSKPETSIYTRHPAPGFSRAQAASRRRPTRRSTAVRDQPTLAGNVAANRARVARHLGSEQADVVTLYQVHSATALSVTGPVAANDRPKADACRHIDARTGDRRSDRPTARRCCLPTRKPVL